MKAALVFLALFGLVFARNVPEVPVEDEETQKYIVIQRSDGLFQIEDVSQGEIEAFASQSDVTFYYYSRNYRNGVLFTHNTVGNLQRTTDYNVNRRTLFIAHGWTNNYRSDVNVQIMNAALAANDVNVFVVDWSPVASRNYITAQGSVRQVGEFVGSFIGQLQSLYGQNLATVTISGHSLGAHVAGSAGAALGGRVGTIVGLDPAGPLFTQANIHNRVDPTDGIHVEIIHTNDGMLGYGITMGDVDHYPNGGRSQPGCGIDLAGSCAHSRAYIYYAESLLSNRFAARNCDSFNDFTAGRCSTRTLSHMGTLVADTWARGAFFMETNNNSPYGRGTA